MKETPTEKFISGFPVYFVDSLEFAPTLSDAGRLELMRNQERSTDFDPSPEQLKALNDGVSFRPVTDPEEDSPQPDSIITIMEPPC